MSMWKSVKELLRILKNDPKTKGTIPELKALGKKTFFWLILAEAAAVLQVYPIKYFFNGIEHGKGREYLLAVCAAFFLLYLVTAVLKERMDNCRNTFFWRMWTLWWGYGHRRQLRLSTDWHVAHSTGEKESILSKNVNKVENLVDRFVFDTIPLTVQIVFVSIVVSILNWKLGLLALLTLIVYTAVLLVNERGIMPLRHDFRKRIKRIELDGSELTKNWRTEKQFGIEEDKSDANEALLMDFWESEKWRHKAFQRFIIRQEYVVIAAESLFYLLIAWTFIPGSEIGTVVLSSAWMSMIFSRLHRFSSVQRDLNEGLEALKELLGLLTLMPTIRQADQPVWREKFSGSVEFRNVSFSYPNGKKNALQKINLTAYPNQTVALVGFSGSGKSTVASLLLREYDPTEGEILIDSVDLKVLDFDRYRKELVAVVSQDVQLFEGTIRDNIRLTRPHASSEEESEAARHAYANEFIETLPEGYDTQIGEDGIRLSGGQRQRLAIARALIRKPRILILDEATSSLDAVSQKRVQEAIDHLIARRESTIFVIAHRFSTIMSADMVVVLKDGEIAEMGSHEELARQNGIYRRLRDLETEGILETE